MEIRINEIGFVENDVEQRTDENWGKVRSKILLNKEYEGGLKGLEEFSHAIILTFLHEAKYISNKHLKRRPRNLNDMPQVGIFSQRAKNRPNPIGITSVKVIEASMDYLIVEGLDAINGTPVIDIKPYYPQYDKMNKSTVPEWVDRLMKNYF